MHVPFQFVSIPCRLMPTTSSQMSFSCESEPLTSTSRCAGCRHVPGAPVTPVRVVVSLHPHDLASSYYGPVSRALRASMSSRGNLGNKSIPMMDSDMRVVSLFSLKLYWFRSENKNNRFKIFVPCIASPFPVAQARGDADARAAARRAKYTSP